MTFSQNERAGLVRAAQTAGPDAPTLCEGWTVRDLVAHLVLRESLRFDNAAGIAVPMLAARTARAQQKVAERGWESLLDAVAGGPPWYTPFALVDRAANLVEMFIHHEDILRAQPGHRPRTATPGLRKALARPMRLMGAVALQKTPGSVTLSTPQGAVLARGGQGGEPVAVTGEIEELVLFAYGRKPVTVALDGSEAAKAAVLAAPRGI
ncbi:TIGR03085 family metal-binding protein [Segniliparus rugosus]|uniref:TIGR03085 family protein n=1 Tax=Segniliparus rugosus (strain ATCC BAA-974 / DSM 45345 / CCUG 50838 / CIP 108380 / JCM 13579 / CDC 945) TaxID=679197 RepID=E5XP70_SEGRC|nr:TIGR03085 family metal-binding protein [Segniliparus rugosus]EFV13852.1 TIGR03085 family protein [Segniliparus rugosus ATCC BAA-974]